MLRRFIDPSPPPPKFSTELENTTAGEKNPRETRDIESREVEKGVSLQREFLRGHWQSVDSNERNDEEEEEEEEEREEGEVPRTRRTGHGNPPPISPRTIHGSLARVSSRKKVKE